MRAVADLLYPESCIGCGRLARGGLCRRCLSIAARSPAGVCNRCGAGAAADVPHCKECRGREFSFDRARQCAQFTSTARLAILRLKYRGQLGLAEVLALPMADMASVLQPQVVTWVPTSNRRVRERGFDHAQLLAEAVARQLDVFCSGMIERVRETPPQVGLDPAIRRTNLVGAFACRLPAPDRVLVIDDVFTTGASASEAARALKAAGAREVDSLAFARA
jgi:competence protein ComFC